MLLISTHFEMFRIFRNFRHSFSILLRFHLVLVIVIITGLTSPSYSGKWETPGNGSDSVNGTEGDLAMAAIGQYVSNRNTIGVDKTGHIKPKWCVTNRLVNTTHLYTLSNLKMIL